MNHFVLVIFLSSELVSLFLIISLWRRGDKWWRKFFWTLIVVVPILGPLFYGGMYRLPSKHTHFSESHLQEGAEVAWADHNSDHHF